MIYSLLADLVMTVHFAFVAFVALGALLLLREPRVAWLHVPAVLYGAAIEFFGWICPLTPLEVALRRAAGSEGYEGSFLRHHLEKVLYPADWQELHLWLGLAALLGNAALYAWILLLRRRSRRSPSADRSSS